MMITNDDTKTEIIEVIGNTFTFTFDKQLISFVIYLKLMISIH